MIVPSTLGRQPLLPDGQDGRKKDCDGGETKGDKRYSSDIADIVDLVRGGHDSQGGHRLERNGAVCAYF